MSVRPYTPSLPAQNISHCPFLRVLLSTDASDPVPFRASHTLPFRCIRSVHILTTIFVSTLTCLAATHGTTLARVFFKYTPPESMGMILAVLKHILDRSASDTMLRTPPEPPTPLVAAQGLKDPTTARQLQQRQFAHVEH